MRAFIAIGAVVALFWIIVIYVLGQRYANTGVAPEAACRDEQLLLSVNRNLQVITGMQFEGRDMAVKIDWRRWMALDHKRKKDIAMASWCVYSQEKKDGAVLLKSGMDVIGRVDEGVWTSDYGN